MEVLQSFLLAVPGRFRQTEPRDRRCIAREPLPDQLHSILYHRTAILQQTFRSLYGTLLTYVLLRSILFARQRRGGDRIKYSELKKLLKKAGCRMLYEGANHEIWFCPGTGRQFTVSRHKTQEVPTGTLKSIKRAAGVE